MPQSFMYKRVNVFLLVLMCLIVLALGASAIYFQNSFKDLSSNYESVQSNFSTCRDVLGIKEEKLASCIADLNTTSQDIGKYDTLYEQKVDQLETTQNELMLTDRELKNTKLELVKAQNLYQQELSRVTELEKQISFLNQEIVNLQGSLNSCRSQLDACQ